MQRDTKQLVIAPYHAAWNPAGLRQPQRAFGARVEGGGQRRRHGHAVAGQVARGDAVFTPVHAQQGRGAMRETLFLARPRQLHAHQERSQVEHQRNARPYRIEGQPLRIGVDHQRAPQSQRG
ncbi:hypothetical protein D3C81_1761420 [compost metagenome]